MDATAKVSGKEMVNVEGRTRNQQKNLPFARSLTIRANGSTLLNSKCQTSDFKADASF
jgi:hypothetical protein